MNYDDETLMAYADGELDAAQRAAIDAAMATDPGLAHRVAQHRALRAQVAGAFAPLLDQPVPERLESAARGAAAPAAPRGKVLQFPARAARAPVAPWRAPQWAAMAASLLLGVLLSWRLFAPGEGDVITASGGALVARGALASALENQLASQQRREDPVLIGLTFRDRDGGYCRNFTVRATQTAGLGCRIGDAWQIPITTVAELPAGDLQQAGVALPPAIRAAVEARIAGDPLDAAGEQDARGGGWNAKR